MNPDTPLTPGEEVEIRLTAMLMGELSPEEAAALRAQVADNPELEALYARLARAFDLLREASSLDAATESSAPARLSTERRERLLLHFKKSATPRAGVVAKPVRRWTWLGPLAWGVSFAMMLVFLLGDGLRARKRSQATRILEDLRIIDGTVDQFTVESADSARTAGGVAVPEAQSAPEPAAPMALPPAKPAALGDTTIIGSFFKSQVPASLPSPAATPDPSHSLALRSQSGLILNDGSKKSESEANFSLYADRSEAAGQSPVASEPVSGAPANGPAAASSRVFAGRVISGVTDLAGETSRIEEGRLESQIPSHQQLLAANPEVLRLIPGGMIPDTKYKADGLLAGNKTAPTDRAPALKDAEALTPAEKPAIANEDTVSRLNTAERKPEMLARGSDTTGLTLEAEAVGSRTGGLAQNRRLLARDESTTPVDDSAWYFRQDGSLERRSKLAEEQESAKADLKGGKLTYELDVSSVKKAEVAKEADAPLAPPPALPPAIPQPEVATSTNAFSTFSLNVSDVAFKLAGASLEQGKMPDPAAIRSEEFINAFDYHDPEPAAGVALAFASERARYPFAQNRDLIRFSIKTAAAGRQPGRPLNLVLLLDNSGSMERADRVRILRESLRVLSAQLQPHDKLSIITFARTPRLWFDGVAGNQAAEVTQRVAEITPQGGTNLDAALELGYETAHKHYQATSINRVVLLTDGAANLGDVNPTALKQKVESQRKQGIALDCFGVGWEGYNDDLLEQLSRNGDGRYGFINSPEDAATEFAAQLAGALRVAASDVKVQVEFNPKRVTAYRQIGYAKHQLTKEQFRDNTVDAAEIGAAESGNALYVVEVNPRGEGDLATVRARFKVPGTSDYREHQWSVPFNANPPALEQSSPTLRLAATASAFSEWLAGSPYATEITSDQLLGVINGVPSAFGNDPRPQRLEWMIRQAKSLSGR